MKQKQYKYILYRVIVADKIYEDKIRRQKAAFTSATQAAHQYPGAVIEVYRYQRNGKYFEKIPWR